MRRMCLVGLTSLLVALPLGGQRHAPTVAQCRADVAAWENAETWIDYGRAQTAFLRDHVPNNTEISRLYAIEVARRQDEMADCIAADHDNADKYNITAFFYRGVLGDRMLDFVMRHDLLNQFRQEDAQGER